MQAKSLNFVMNVRFEGLTDKEPPKKLNAPVAPLLPSPPPRQEAFAAKKCARSRGTGSTGGITLTQGKLAVLM